MASVKIMVKGPGEKEWHPWATLADRKYEGEARDLAGEWVRQLQAEVEYEIVPA